MRGEHYRLQLPIEGEVGGGELVAGERVVRGAPPKIEQPVGQLQRRRGVPLLGDSCFVDELLDLPRVSSRCGRGGGRIIRGPRGAVGRRGQPRRQYPYTRRGEALIGREK